MLREPLHVSRNAELSLWLQLGVSHKRNLSVKEYLGLYKSCKSPEVKWKLQYITPTDI